MGFAYGPPYRVYETGGEEINPTTYASLRSALCQRGKPQLSRMMSVGNLQVIFGDKVTSFLTETVLAITQAQVWGGVTILRLFLSKIK